MKNKLYCLVACECSQRVTSAIRDLGHVAYSCDIQPVRFSQRLDWHIPGDCSPLLHGEHSFICQDGHRRSVPHWDLVIAHPPCTYLTKVGAVHMWKDGQLNRERYANMLRARRFFLSCLDAQANFVVIENPQPMALAKLPRADHFADPSWFGDRYTKKTLFWTKTLPPLVPTLINTQASQLVHCSRGKYRSVTQPNMAFAMAKQWTDFILDEYKRKTEILPRADPHRTFLP